MTSKVFFLSFLLELSVFECIAKYSGPTHRWIGWIRARLWNVKNSAANILNQADEEIVVERANVSNRDASLKEVTDYKIPTYLGYIRALASPHARGHILYGLKHPCHAGSTTQNGSKERKNQQDEYGELARGWMQQWAWHMCMYLCCIPPTRAEKEFAVWGCILEASVYERLEKQTTEWVKVEDAEPTRTGTERVQEIERLNVSNARKGEVRMVHTARNKPGIGGKIN
ncbi:hypothetical protein B0H13DRAFT_1883689 [Mycena leptocephala]|nr:hypothetical protein B0H13DRAFT_1883689 [Mycena leptocephala]